MSCNYTKSLENKKTRNIVNASYSFTQFSTLAKIYTTTAREPSIYIQCNTQLPKNIRLNIFRCERLCANDEECPPGSNCIGVREDDGTVLKCVESKCAHPYLAPNGKQVPNISTLNNLLLFMSRKGPVGG